jgi:uncharacterized protein (TIGR00375 family)
MRYIADLHIHSCYSRATSKASRLPGLAAWAAIKGIRVLGTGDFTHPAWLQHLSEHLEPAEPGFFKLRSWNIDEISTVIPEGVRIDDLPIGDIRFVLSSEISSIYKKDGKVRKIHNILYAPDFDTVRRINGVLAGIGNIESDGRPILGLDARILLEILLEQGPGGFFIPAHIWTPWFSLFGSRSGFDVLEECFGDLSPEIFALETGLSSDPAMNRCISALDRYTLISNSDCHSPAKLGREANILDTDLSFPALQAALRSPLDQNGHQAFAATIEFYPEEGKYHNDGHRKCQACLEPNETIKQKGLCPVCGKPVTVGVLHRVVDLADRKYPLYPENSPAVHSLIPLPEILSELLTVGPASKKVMRTYARLINTFGSEFNLLLDVPISDISTNGSPFLGEAIERVRKGKVIRQPGYDGEFGVIRVFAEEELSKLAGQLTLFGETPRRTKKKTRPQQSPGRKKRQGKKKKVEAEKTLNPAQQAAVTSSARYILVQAGPGTGKTHTLVARIVHQLQQNTDPATVMTFTNKAAGEVQERLNKRVPGNSVYVTTLHGYCLHLLRRQDSTLQVAGPAMRTLLLRQYNPALTSTALKQLSETITSVLLQDNSVPDETISTAQVKEYFQILESRHLIDIDAIVPHALALLRKDNTFSLSVRESTGAVYIDEFQDLNAIQYQLVQTLATSADIFAIGDPDQAIYGFRGADPHWFYQFIQDVDPEVYYLNYNYRCDKNIVKAANTVIARNTASGRRTSSISTKNGQIFLHKLQSPFAEARFIVHRIEELVGGTSHREIEKLTTDQYQDISLADIGILYRTTRQAQVIAGSLFKQGIPYQVVHLEPFYQKEPVKILYYWMLLAAGLADLTHLLFLLGLEPGIGRSTLAKVENQMVEQTGEPLAALAALPLHQGKVKQALALFEKFTEQICTEATGNDVAAGIVSVLDHYDISKEDIEVQRFCRLAGAIGGSLAEFAAYLQQNARSVVYDEQAEAVTLMTLHAAKGIEFPVVFLTGLEDNRLPLQPREQLAEAEYAAHVEEERRLFFVGLTRAKHQLYLSWSEQGVQKGKSGKPSRFIDAIPKSLIEHEMPGKKRKIKPKQLSLFS